MRWFVDTPVFVCLSTLMFGVDAEDHAVFVALHIFSSAFKGEHFLEFVKEGSPDFFVSFFTAFEFQFESDGVSAF